MKQIQLYPYFLFVLLGLFHTQNAEAQTAPTDIDYTVGAGGDFLSNPNAEFAFAINPAYTFPAVPAAAEFNAIMYIPTAMVTGNEVFTVLDDATNGGNINYQGPGYAHTDGNTYFSFVYSGSGINLSNFGSGSFQLILSVDVANSNPSAIWEIADGTTSLYTDFNIRSAINVLEFNELHLSAGAPLPIDLIRFEVEAIGHKSHLTWQTASEQDNQYFSIERSKDGKYFEEIDRVTGAGSSSALKNYQTWDVYPHPGTNYYRLKQIDFNGEFDYSEIRVVEFSSNEVSISIYPNPSNEWLNIQLGEKMIPGNLKIFDSLGKLVLVEPLKEQAVIKTLSTQQFPAGVYQLVISFDHQLFSKKFIVQHHN